MIVAIKIAALLVVTLTVVTSVAHALEYPGKMRLSREHYLAVQPIYYPGFTYAGAAEPLAIVIVAILLALTPAGTVLFWLTAGTLVFAAATHLLYWVLTAPVNKVWLKNEALSDGARSFFGSAASANDGDWIRLRDRWERSHLYRASTASTALVLLAFRVVIE